MVRGQRTSAYNTWQALLCTNTLEQEFQALMSAVANLSSRSLHNGAVAFVGLWHMLRIKKAGPTFHYLIELINRDFLLSIMSFLFPPCQWIGITTKHTLIFLPYSFASASSAVLDPQGLFCEHCIGIVHSLGNNPSKRGNSTRRLPDSSRDYNTPFLRFNHHQALLST